MWRDGSGLATAMLGRSQMTYTLDEESKADLKSISQVSVMLRATGRDEA